MSTLAACSQQRVPDRTYGLARREAKVERYNGNRDEQRIANRKIGTETERREREGVEGS